MSCIHGTERSLGSLEITVWWGAVAGKDEWAYLAWLSKATVKR